VDVAGEKLFTGPRFPNQQHARVRAGGERCLLHRSDEAGARSDHPRRASDHFPQTLVLAAQIRLLERVLQGKQHLVSPKRFLQKVKRPGARRLYRLGDRAVPGDHDYRRFISRLPDGTQKLDPVAVGKAHVEQIGVCASLRLELGRRAAGRHRVAFPLENQPQGPADILLVIHD
jgi:hypothetical protein